MKDAQYEHYDVTTDYVSDRKAVFVSDKREGGYTAWYVDEPGAVVEGDTIEDCKKQLPIALEILLGD